MNVFTPAFAVVSSVLPFRSAIAFTPESGRTMIASVPSASITPTETSGAPPAARLIIEAQEP